MRASIQHSLRLSVAIALLMPCMSAAQSIRVRAGEGSVSIAPGSTGAVPIMVDLAQAAPLNVASISARVTWDPSRVSYVTFQPGAFGSVTVNADGAGAGGLQITAFSTAGARTTFTVGTLHLRAGTTLGPTPLTIQVAAIGNELGQSVLNYVSVQPGTICVGQSGLWGDVNADQKVDIIDAQQIARYAVSLSVADLERLRTYGDVNQDAVVNILDAQIVARYSASLSTPGSRVGTSAGSGCTSVGGSAPVTTTTPATEITSVSARINGQVDPKGSASVWFEWATNPSLSNPSFSGRATATAVSNWWLDLSSLTSGTTYYYRVVAENSGGVSHGAIMSFTTGSVSATLPLATTTPATGVTANGARVNGTVDPRGAASVWFEWSTSPTMNNLTASGKSTATAPSNWWLDLSSLAGSTMYYFRIVAENAAGRTNGSVMSFTTGTTVSSGYSMEVRFLSTFSAEHQRAIRNAAARWERVILGDLPNIPVNLASNGCFAGSPAINETVDDLLIYVAITGSDGPGGNGASATSCWIRTAGGQAIIGYVRFDIADLPTMSEAMMYDLTTHEFGHVLGIGGNLWFPRLVGIAGFNNRAFVGNNAVAAFLATPGASSYPGTPVPVEDVGGQGTIDVHFRESVMGRELMTGHLNFGGNPLSRITIAAMQDFGYVVNFGAAEGYTVGSGATVGSRVDPTRKTALDDVLPPIGSIDTKGRVFVFDKIKQ